MAPISLQFCQITSVTNNETLRNPVGFSNPSNCNQIGIENYFSGEAKDKKYMESKNVIYVLVFD